MIPLELNDKKDVPLVDKNQLAGTLGSVPHFVEAMFFADGEMSINDPVFFKIALDCYVGLASALLKRADLLSKAIRDIEKKFELPYSIMNVSQRRGGDLEDLVHGLYEQYLVDRYISTFETERTNLLSNDEKSKLKGEELKTLALQDNAKAKALRRRILEKKRAREAAQKKATQQALEDKAAGGKGGVIGSGLGMNGKIRGGGGGGVNKSDTESENEYETNEQKEAILQMASLQAAHDKKMKKFRVTLEYLLEQRRLVLVWAASCSETVDSLLKLCGWDPQSSAFHPEENYGDLLSTLHTSSGTSPTPLVNVPKAVRSGGALDPQCVEPWARELRPLVIRAGFVHGRIHQSMGFYYRAQYHFRNVLMLAKGYLPVIEELAKTLIAQGELPQARVLVYGLVKRLCPELLKLTESETGDPYPMEIMAINRRLGCLAVLVENGKTNLRHCNVGTVYQQQIFNVNENGLMTRPRNNHIEIIHGRLLDDSVRLKRDEKEQEKMFEILSTREELLLQSKKVLTECFELNNTCTAMIQQSRSVRTPGSRSRRVIKESVKARARALDASKEANK